MWRLLSVIIGMVFLCASHGIAQNNPNAQIQPSPGQAFLNTQTPDTVKKLMTDGVVVSSNSTHVAGSTGEFISAIVLFEQDVDTVLRLLSATARQAEYLPVLHKATTLEHYPNGDLDQHELKVLLIDIVYRVKHQWNFADHTMQWQLDPTFHNDLRDVQGRWKLYPLDSKRTVGQYMARVDVGRAVPRFIQNFLTKKDLPKALKSQRQWVNSLGTYRKT